MNVLQQSDRIQSLLTAADPAPADVINGASTHPVLLVCEHAGHAIPGKLRQLGLSNTVQDSHISWDIGASRVAVKVANELGATLIQQPYSRLVIDCNRPTDANDSIPENSHGIFIPGNQKLTATERQQRIDEIFIPYQQKIQTQLDNGAYQAVFSIHSFTPELAGARRPWDIGFLFRKDTRTSTLLKKTMGKRNPELNIGMNEPYSVDDASDWFIPVHAEPRGIPHSLIEIRNNHLLSEQGCRLWAAKLVDALTAILPEL